jgi:hypothetical protein
MQCMMMFWEDTSEMQAGRSGQDAAYWPAWMAYVTALQASGLVVSGNGLQPPATGTLLRLRDGKRVVQDGPYADTKEQLGGYFILEVPDMATAMEWAARAPNAGRGTVELRPVLPPPPAAAVAA